MNIDKIIPDISRPKMIMDIPGGRHCVKAKKILNEILCENPCYANAVYLLSQCPAIIWAERNLGKTYYVIRDIEALAGVDYFESPKYRKVKKLEREIGSIFTFILNTAEGTEGEVLNAVHGFGHNVSDYLISSHYKNAVVGICTKHNGKINQLSAQLVRAFNMLTEEQKIAYHNMDLLISMAREGLSDKDARVELKEIGEDMLFLSDTLGYFRAGNGDFPFIVKDYLSGMPETAIAKEYERSRSYIRKRYKEGITLLSLQLFGFTNRETLTWLSDHYEGGYHGNT